MNLNRGTYFNMLRIGVLAISLLAVIVTRTYGRNIVLILADDLGWNDVGYHNCDMKTPNIDQLAREGVIINSSYVQPVCSPSRSALMTGVYPFRYGLQSGVIRPDVPECAPLRRKFLSENLKELGYATHIVGKWHLGHCNLNCTPTFRGFDSFLGFYNGREDYYSKISASFLDFRDGIEPVLDTEYSTTLYGKRAIEIIKNHNASKPLFLYLPFQAPHCPLQVPELYINRYPPMKNERRRIFSAIVTAMDRAIGKVVKALKRKGIYEDTLIIFSSDNGGEPTSAGNNYPLRGAKATIFEGGTRAVSFVHGSGLKNTNAVYDGLFHIVDWYPTIYAAAGGNMTNMNTDIDGINQWDAISSGGSSDRNEIVYNIDETLIPSTGRAAIRVGDYKLIHGYPGVWQDWYKPQDIFFSDACGPKELKPLFDNLTNTDFCQNRDLFDGKMLFNLKQDPYERTDISADFPEVVNQLSEKLDNYRRVLTPPRPQVVDPNANPSLHGGYWGSGWC